MVKINCTNIISEIQLASKAIIEHIFDNHEYCDQFRCRPKRELERLNKNEIRRELDDNKN